MLDLNVSNFTERYKPFLKNRVRWLTISPQHSENDTEDDYRMFLENVSLNFSFAGNLVGVAEVENLRLHYHIIYELKPGYHKYEYIKLNGIRNGCPRKRIKPCMVRVYDGFPKEGIEYLFKDLNKTLDYIYKPIFTRGLPQEERSTFEVPLVPKMFT